VAGRPAKLALDVGDGFALVFITDRTDGVK
jgi:hypothetical protein